MAKSGGKKSSKDPLSKTTEAGRRNRRRLAQELRAERQSLAFF